MVSPGPLASPALLGVGDLRHDRGGDVVHRHRKGTREETRQEPPDETLGEEVETWRFSEAESAIYETRINCGTYKKASNCAK